MQFNLDPIDGTGIIWREAPRKRAQVVRRVCEKLEKVYGRPSLGNPTDPLDDMIFIILSNRTSPGVAKQNFERLKRNYPSWDGILESSLAKFQSLIARGGLSNKRALQIRDALAKIKRDRGECDLSFLKEYNPGEMEAYLIALPGLSDKVAKCVMMYTLGVEVLPVDSHVHRISRRLGWTDRMRPDQCHEELEALVPPHRRYAYHVDCVLHGRNTCRPAAPKCGECPIMHHCIFPRID